MVEFNSWYLDSSKELLRFCPDTMDGGGMNHGIVRVIPYPKPARCLPPAFNIWVCEEGVFQEQITQYLGGSR